MLLSHGSWVPVSRLAAWFAEGSLSSSLPPFLPWHKGWEAGRWYLPVARASPGVIPWRPQAGTGWSHWGWCQGCPPAVPWSPTEPLAVFAVNPPSLLMVMQGKLCAGGLGAPVNYCRQ